ncbi:cytochrome-c oxidase [Halobiforma lacisalsi AJ5]|uniref:Cytochrome c oxidase subunit I n=2 Tax=Natronobacterium lacisalsi TaxID=229731 RepID=M0LEZ7_NATLA|nr:cbb3-type cytochrome c oxidase subunit I [Halobiforma lacisalsi]APW99557.1 cytochrome-c oxidase [Halobiforma lacisalsi AJ5]EMA31683.1 cytochrome c oxidase subunit I [Halobiforma lacisalsi AJ5]
MPTVPIPVPGSDQPVGTAVLRFTMLETIPGVVVAAVIAAALLTYYRLRSGRPARSFADGGTASVTVGLTGTEKPAGLLRWFTTVDHKDIGLLYILFGTAAALWGATDAMMIRTELLVPETAIWNVETYNAVFTTHGFTMLFFFVTPVFTGIANYVLPLLLGADDLAFPRINAIAFWLLPPSLLLVRGGLITDVMGMVLGVLPLDVSALEALEPVGMGWTMYTPLSVEMANPQISVALLGLHLSGVATTMAAINFIVTVLTERPDDLGWDRLDIFSWNILVTSGLILLAFPLLGSTLIMLLLDRNFGTTFFAIEGGGPMLWQHLFWFFGHPEVYILVLPAFGLISLILPKFCGRRLFGFRFIVYSTIAIGVMSFGVWAHHMFATGMDPRLRASFMAVSLAIAIPSAIKEFNWIATMWNGRLRLDAPLICIIGGLSTFVVGGITGVFLAAVPVDLVLHDTHYVVGHFHLIVVGVIPLAMIAASYYWFPLITGRMYNQRLARVQSLLLVVGSFVTFLPLLVLGYEGMPRRYGVYPAEFITLNQIASLGALVLGVSVVLWLVNMVQSARVGPVVRDADVWNLKETGQFTREWQWFEERLEDRRADSTRPESSPERTRAGEGTDSDSGTD